ncbi:MAG: hypothetical protein ACON5B_09720, partial [Myxococcota bacterium]
MTFTEVLIVALGVSLALLVPFGMAAIWLVVMSFARHDASEAPVRLRQSWLEPSLHLSDLTPVHDLLVSAFYRKFE